MENLYPAPSGEPARQGTAAAWVAEQLLRGVIAGPTAPNGVSVTDEMRAHANSYLEMAQDGRGVWHAEESVQCPRVHPTCSGTPDLWYVLAALYELHVWDYKYGFGIVEAYENWQEICYFSGIMDLLRGSEAHGIFDQRWTVVFHIYQPRAYHPEGHHRTWRVAAADLRAYVNRLNAAALIALGPDPRCLQGAHCKYCTARRGCPSAGMWAGWASDYAYAATPNDLTPEQMGVEINTLRAAADAIKYRLTALEEHALVQGGVPGYGIGFGRGSLDWSVPVKEVLAIGDAYGVDLRNPDAVKTPTMAKTIGGIPKEVIEAITTKTPGKRQLMPQENTIAARAFGPRSINP